MEEAPENGKESSNSAHANGMNEVLDSPWNNRKIPFIFTESAELHCY